MDITEQNEAALPRRRCALPSARTARHRVLKEKKITKEHAQCAYSLFVKSSILTTTVAASARALETLDLLLE
jgi:hypothetical protein